MDGARRLAAGATAASFSGAAPSFPRAASASFPARPRRRCGSLARHLPQSSLSSSALGHDRQRRGPLEIALELFTRMDARPNEHVYASVARSCAALPDIAAGAQVHARAVKSRFLGASFVANSISSMYIKCGCFEEGYGVFRALAEPTVVSYNAVISGLAASYQPARGLEMLRLMKLRGLHPDRFSYAAAIGICSDLHIGAVLHSDTVKIGGVPGEPDRESGETRRRGSRRDKIEKNDS